MSSFKNTTRVLAAGAVLLATLVFAQHSLADRVQLDVQVGTPVMIEGARQTAFIKVGLTGFPLEVGEIRTPVNVAIVLDRSGSMSGQKMRKAKEAAIMAVDRLGQNDIVSVIAYNHTVEVLVPSTKVRDRDEIARRINSLYPTGNTALFAGVSKGSYEVRKFIERNRVNRVILVSDGLANVGPSSPGELGSLGWSLAKEGISVTTIGLGDDYNEDLMVKLAMGSDGNHAFAENATDLSRIFSHEFGDVLSVVAREVLVRIRCAPGIRPVRVLGRRAEINGNEIVASLNQIYANQEKFLLLEVEVPAGRSGVRLELASIDVNYANTVSQTTDMLGSAALISFSNSYELVEKHRNGSVMVASVDLIGNENNKNAVALRDQGKLDEAMRALEDNAVFLEKQAKKYQSKKLKKSAGMNREAKSNMAPGRWKKQRKSMRDEQFMLDMQQAW